ncbi:18728_t:CDS:2 [Funneliformis geosporum]|nr:18728_t:CDS:2 [Funneliformis geosporum]
MSIQEAQHENPVIPKGQDDVVYDYEQHGTSIIYEKLMIPSSSQYLNLISKALCRKYYNKLIVNAKKTKANNVCLHPKHQFYISTARHDTETKSIKKALEWLIKFFELPQEYLISGIETNCNAFQKSLNSSDTRAKDENIDEMDIAKPSDDPNTRDEDFLLDRNIDHDNMDLLFKKTINALTSAQFTI